MIRFFPSQDHSLKRGNALQVRTGFELRAELHRIAYQHKTVKKLETHMIEVKQSNTFSAVATSFSKCSVNGFFPKLGEARRSILCRVGVDSGFPFCG